MRKISVLIAAALACLPAVAQNINQSVEVSNDYLGRMGEVNKQGVAMMVPDTLLHFDYAFDYSVFETPYKGAYDFSPYLVNFTPQKSRETGRKLFLRAGAGFTMRPEVDFAYVPVDGDTLSLALYNHGNGYAGRYAAPDVSLSSINGYDFRDEMGLNGHVRMNGAIFTFRAGWEGIFSKGYTAKSIYNSAFAGMRLKSTSAGGTFFYYDFGADYRYARDVFGPYSSFGENDVRVDGAFGQVIKSKYRLLLDFDVEHDALSSDLLEEPHSFTLLGAVPHLLFTFGNIDLKAGARLDYAISPYGNRLALSPDVEGSLTLKSGRFTLLGGLVGGQRLNTYNSFKHRNHFFSHPEIFTPPTWERWNVFAGFRGSAGQHLQYSLKGGYTSLYEAPFDYWFTYEFDSAKQAYADAAFSWIEEGFELLGAMSYRYTQFRNPGGKFVPAPFSGNVRATRSFYDRMSVSLEADWATRREAPSTAGNPYIPGFVDLSLGGEYMLNTGFGVWAKLGNLACMAIQRTPGYICKGPYITAGIVLNM